MQRMALGAHFPSMGLRDSWADDAFLRDRASGRNLDPTKPHRPDHEEHCLKARGPLTLATSPPGYPVVAHAGDSEDDMELAAQATEAVIQSCPRMQDAQDCYAAVEDRMAKYGRPPNPVKMAAWQNVTVTLPTFIRVTGARVDLAESRAASETAFPRNSHQIDIRADEYGKSTIRDHLMEGLDAAHCRSLAFGAVELRRYSVVPCPRERTNHRRCGAGGWKPRWLIIEQAP